VNAALRRRTAKVRVAAILARVSLDRPTSEARKAPKRARRQGAPRARSAQPGRRSRHEALATRPLVLRENPAVIESRVRRPHHGARRRRAALATRPLVLRENPAVIESRVTRPHHGARRRRAALATRPLVLRENPAVIESRVTRPHHGAHLLADPRRDRAEQRGTDPRARRRPLRPNSENAKRPARGRVKKVGGAWLVRVR